jgi:soluble lytic murein transglycosylase-like protein
MPTIIDSLLVTLGLDTKGFKEGAAEAERAQEKLKDTARTGAKSVSDANTAAGTSAAKLGKTRKVESEAEEKRQREGARRAKERHADEKKRTDATIEGLKTLGLYAAGALVGFESLQGALATYAATSGELAGIGRLAPTIGASVEEVGSLGKALQVVGGAASDAQADIAKLGHAQFSLLMHAPDALAGFARRMGVSLFDPRTGQARDKVAILKDIGERLRQMTPDVQAQAMYAREMGLSEATIQLFVVKQAAERDKILADAEAANRVTVENTKNAQALAGAYANVRNQIKGVVESIVGATSPALTKGLNALSELMAAPHTAESRFLQSIGLGKGPGPGKSYGAAAAPYTSAFAAAEKKYHLPPGLLAAIAKQESNFDPTAVSKAGARGLMQLNPKNFKGAGADPFADIDTAAAELMRLFKFFRKSTASNQTAWQLALGAYNRGQGNLAKDIASGGKVPAETQSYVPSVLGNIQRNAAFSAGAAAPVAASSGSSTPTAMNGGPSTSVQIDEINIVTQATDASGIASTIAPALQRKGVVAQANSGLS